MAWRRRLQSPWAGLAALLLGLALGALFPLQLAWFGRGVEGAFRLLAEAVPVLILLTLLPALLALLRSGTAARFAGAVVGAMLALMLAAGLLAVAMLVPMFQLAFASGGSGQGSAALRPDVFALALTARPVQAIAFAVVAAALLHLGARSRALAWFCRPTSEVVARVGVDGVELLGRGLKLAMAPLLLLVGVFIPTAANDAASAGGAAVQGSAALGGLSPVAWYFLSVGAHVLILAVFLAGATFGMARLTGFPLRRFASQYLAYVYPFAWSTASSAATLPINLERARDALGARPEVRDFIMPLGATVNRTGSVISAFVLTVVAGLLVGYKPTLPDLLVLLLPLTLVIAAAPPVPAGTAIVGPPVALAVLPIPPEAQAAFAAVFFAFGVGLSDQFRTGVNAVSNGVLCVLFEHAWPRWFATASAGSRPRAAMARRAPHPPGVRRLRRAP